MNKKKKNVYMYKITQLKITAMFHICNVFIVRNAVIAFSVLLVWTSWLNTNKNELKKKNANIITILVTMISEKSVKFEGINIEINNSNNNTNNNNHQ